MAQLISISKISQLNFLCSQSDDIFQEYQKAYQKLEQILDNEKILFFAQPQQKGEDQISWLTNIEGNIFTFPKAQETIERPLELLEQQANALYMHIIDKIQDSQKRLEYINLLDKCLTINSQNDIYLIINTDGKKQFCITGWGSNSKGKINILNSIVNAKKTNIKIKITQNNKPLAKKNIEIKLDEDQTLNLISDEHGYVYINDIELLKEFTVIERDATKIIKQRKYIVDRTEFKFEVKSNTIPKVIIKAVDSNGNPLKSTDFVVKIGEKKLNLKTDENGILELSDVPVESQITVYQQISAAKNISKTYKISSDSDVTLKFVGEKLSGNYLIIKVIDANGKPFPGAQMEIKIGDRTIRKDSNEQGIVLIQDLPLNTNIQIRQLINGVASYQKNMQYTGEVKEVTFKSHETRKILKEIKVRLLNARNNPVKNVSIKLKNGYDWQFAITDAQGFATFTKVNCAEPVSVEIKHRHYEIKRQLDCTEQQEFEISLAPQKHSKALLWIILGIIGLAIIAGIIAVIPKNISINTELNKNSHNTVHQDTQATVAPKPKPIESKIYVLDHFTLAPVTNFNVLVDSNLIVEKKLDSGYFVLRLPQDTSINLTITAPNYDTLSLKFKPTAQFTTYLNSKDLYIAQDTTCNAFIYSRPIRNYIQTIKFKQPVSSFRLKFIKRYVSDQIFIYRGNKDQMSTSNLIWQYTTVEPDTLTSTINLQTADSLITIAIKAGEAHTPLWRYKIYCK